MKWFKQLWCWLRHGHDVDVNFYSNRTAGGYCKLCGAWVEY